MIVRRADVDDAAAIAAVHTRTWLVAYDGIVDRALMEERIPGREDRWRATLTDGTPTWVAVEDATIVGFCTAAQCRDEDAGPHVGEIWALYVDPAAEGRGAGRALMDTAVEALREAGLEEVTLWVFEANAAGRGFYERMGWVHDAAAGVSADLWAPEVRYRRTI